MWQCRIRSFTTLTSTFGTGKRPVRHHRWTNGVPPAPWLPPRSLLPAPVNGHEYLAVSQQLVHEVLEQCATAQAAVGGGVRAYVRTIVNGDIFRVDVDSRGRWIRILGATHS